MSDWFSYRIQDYVPFSADAYFSLLARMNEAYWPLHLIMVAIGVTAVCLSLTDRNRIIGLMLAPAWCFVGVVFVMELYGQLNWGARYFAYAFLIQAVVLVIVSVSGVGCSPKPQCNSFSVFLGVLVAMIGLVFYPFLLLLAGFSWSESEVFGIHPDPTAVATLGIAMTCYRGIAKWVVSLIPVLWILQTGLTLQVLGSPLATILFGVLVIAFAGMVIKKR